MGDPLSEHPRGTAPVPSTAKHMLIRRGLLGWAALVCLGKLSALDLPYSTWLLVSAGWVLLHLTSHSVANFSRESASGT